MIDRPAAHELPLDGPLRWSETLVSGASWSMVCGRGSLLRLTDLRGGGNVACLFYNATQPLERYNMADTLKAQHTARLTQGHVLYSDMGRILCSIVSDSCGWHDPLGGLSNAALVEQRYGASSYATHRNARHLNATDSLLVELGKFGLGLRDLVPNVNFFSRLDTDEQGRLHHVDHNARPGDHVALRFEMPTLVVLSTVQHAYDSRGDYDPRPVELSFGLARTPGPDDPCRSHCAENARGFVSTDRAFA